MRILFLRNSALSLLTLAVFGLAPPALAADPAYRTNTGPNGADFSGVSLGADAGVALGSAGGANSSGPAGGAHLGYNFQSNGLVGGAEIDGMFGSIRTGSLGVASFNQNFLSSARVKAGYAFGDILGYGTVGMAYSTATYEDPTGSQNKTIKGYVLGVGAEYALTRIVSIRLEYLRYDFGNATYNTPFASKPIYTDTNLLRVGASVHF
jgi:outer membrane immunogenic protein